jgi:hypothetical protein
MALIPDRAEVLVDAKDDEDELGGDPREDNPGDDADDARKDDNETAERAYRHCRQAGKDTGQAEENDQTDHEAIERLDDSRGDECVPLEKVPVIEHHRPLVLRLNSNIGRLSPGKSIDAACKLVERIQVLSVRRDSLLNAYGLTPNSVPGKIEQGAMRAQLLRLPQTAATIGLQFFVLTRFLHANRSTLRSKTL